MKKKFFFSLPLFCSSLKNTSTTSTTQTQLPIIHVSMFQKLTYIILLQNKASQPHPPPPPPFFVKVVEIIKKIIFSSVFPNGFPLLIVRPSCNTDLIQISLVSLKQPSSGVFEKQLIFGEFPSWSIKCGAVLQMSASVYVIPLTMRNEQ